MLHAGNGIKESGDAGGVDAMGARHRCTYGSLYLDVHVPCVLSARLVGDRVGCADQLLGLDRPNVRESRVVGILK